MVANFLGQLVHYSKAELSCEYLKRSKALKVHNLYPMLQFFNYETVNMFRYNLVGCGSMHWPI